MPTPTLPSRIAVILALAASLALAACSGGGTSGAGPQCTTAGQCDDANPCTADRCTAGACEHADEPPDTLCTANGGQVCDGAGTCVACNDDAHCAGTSPSTGCQHPACDAHACAPAFAPAGTALPVQVAGDCRGLECDGAGETRSVVDDTDVPDDQEECTTDLCSTGTPQHAATPGVSCGGGAFVCTANGQCGCRGDADCAAPQTCGGGGTPLVCGCTPTTCVAAGATCGSLADGCGGTLDCGGARTGGETDVDCGGPEQACAARCGAGKACVAGADCASGHCADGVCCDVACDGACVACTAAKKGQGSDGVCGAVVSGADPDGDCTAQPAFTCGFTGVCDGAAACRRYSAGTVCGAASCSGATFSPTDFCDGAGTCLDQPAQSCAPYACGIGACRTACVTGADCASGFVCAADACVPAAQSGTSMEERR